MYTDNPIFDRARLLMGDDVMQTIASRRVIIFGVGGVGSWVAECLIRSGIRHLTIVDSDRICASNVNRQLMATSLTVGEVKVDALRRHLLEISPDADILALQKIYSADTADDFALDTYDYIIDAIDSLKDKALLMLRACETRATLFSSMGAALKMDPTLIRVAEFWKVRGCPLGAALRKKFKHMHCRPARKFMCVYGEQVLDNRGAHQVAASTMPAPKSPPSATPRSPTTTGTPARPKSTAQWSTSPPSSASPSVAWCSTTSTPKHWHRSPIQSPIQSPIPAFPKGGH